MTDMEDQERIPEGNYTEGQVLMPFYIVCDVSGSMCPDIEALNAALRDLVKDIADDPVAGDLTMLSIITFDDRGHVVVPLTRPGDIVVPPIRCGGGTSYAEAFRTYHETFEEDRARLKAAGSRVFRPCVFFLTDGEPWSSDTYKQTFRQLLSWDPAAKTGNKAFPYVVAYGFRDATEKVVSSIAYPNFGEKPGRWFLARSSDVHALLKSIADSIGDTVISSGQSGGTGLPQIIVEQPDPSAHMQSGLAVDEFV